MVTVPNFPCCPYSGKISFKTSIKDLTLMSNRHPIAGVTVSPKEEWKDPSLGYSISSHFFSTGRQSCVLEPCICPQGGSLKPMRVKPGAAPGPTDLPHKWDTCPLIGLDNHPAPGTSPRRALSRSVAAQHCCALGSSREQRQSAEPVLVLSPKRRETTHMVPDSSRA